MEGIRVGRIVLNTTSAETFSLDLYETPNLVCRGFYLQPPFVLRDQMGLPEENALPPSEVYEVELTAERRALDEISDGTRIVREVEEPPQTLVEFSLLLMRAESEGMRGEVKRQARDSEGVTELWAGEVTSFEGWEGFHFVLERYGSPETVESIVAVFILIFYFDLRFEAAEARCYQRAQEACGDRGVHRHRYKRTLASIFGAGVGDECEFECASNS